MTPKELLALLDKLGIEHRTVTHEPMFTVEDSRRLREETSGGFTKNLFLRNKKGLMWLVTLEERRMVDLRQLGEALGSGRLSFASQRRLDTYLGVIPGAVSPMALVNDTGNEVKFVIDASLRPHDNIHLHPLDNTMTTTLPTKCLSVFCRHTGHHMQWLAIDGEGKTTLVDES